MATSEKQLAANRRNALKSSGPKSVMGKSISAQNARKHGLLASKVIASSENAQEFLDLLVALRLDFDPRTEFEEQLIEKLAIAFWRGRRLAIAERVDMEGELLDASCETKVSGWGLRQSAGIPIIHTSLLFGRYQTMVTNEIKSTFALLTAAQASRHTTIEGVAREQEVGARASR